jgi:hypothetical protein
LRENIWRKRPESWPNNSWALHHYNARAHASLVVRQLLASTNTTVILHPPYSPDLNPCNFFPNPEDEIEAQGANLTSLKRSKTNRRTWWSWNEMTTSSASDHENLIEIAVSMQKGTTSTGMWANRISVSG